MSTGRKNRNQRIWIQVVFICFVLMWNGAAGRTPRTTTVQVISTNTRTGRVDMQNVLKHMPDTVDKSHAPDNIYHGAVSVFGKVYDFIAEDGIVVTDKDPYFRENVPLWIDGTFRTTNSKAEFVQWVEDQKKHKYTKTSYDLADNNCLHFVADAVGFLGGYEPEKLRNQRIFAENNRENVELLKGLAKAANLTAENMGLFGSVRREQSV